MHILAVGLNYKTAPVEIREQFAIAENELPLALQQLKNTPSVLECAIVGTCNRTELYAVVDRLPLCGQSLRSFMEKWFGVPKQEMTPHLYIYEGDQAIRHLFRVASGLDSLVIGETQILGQVKHSLMLAQQERTTGTIFNTLFKQAVTMAKRAHSETSIGENPVSVSYAAVELGKRIFGDFAQKTVLIIGAGKMSELTAKHLYANGAQKVIVANRTLQRAEELAGKFDGRACGWEELPAALAEADIVISSTGSRQQVLTCTEVKAAMQRRKSRPLFMIDIAVPRDLDPAIGDLPNVFLYDIDDLQMIVESNLKERRKEAIKIDKMIATEMEQFDAWYRTLAVTPVIQALQKKAGDIHQETMESLLRKLPDLDEREITVIRKLTKSMVNQILRDPIVGIKEMAEKRNGAQTVETVTKLFALEDELAGQNRQQSKPALYNAIGEEKAKADLTSAGEPQRAAYSGAGLQPVNAQA